MFIRSPQCLTHPRRQKHFHGDGHKRQGTNSPFRHGTDRNFTPKLERYRIIEPYHTHIDAAWTAKLPKVDQSGRSNFFLRAWLLRCRPCIVFMGFTWIYMDLQYLARLESASSFQSYFVARPQSIGVKCCTPMQITGVKTQRFWPVHEHQVFGVD